MKHSLFASALLVAIWPLGAQQDPTAPMVARLPLSARILSLGGAAAASRDVDGGLGNPAFAGASSGSSLTWGRYRTTTDQWQYANAFSVGSYGVTVGVQYLDYGIVGGVSFPRETDIIGKGYVPAASAMGTLAISTTTKGLRWGVAAKMAQERENGNAGNGFYADLGVMRDIKRVTLGLAAQNLGSGLDGVVSRPSARRLALSGSLPGIGAGPYVDLSFVGGVSLVRDGYVAGSLGGEAAWTPIEGLTLLFRQGVRRGELSIQKHLTGGLGVSLDRFTLDYAWEQMTGSIGHRATLRFR